MITAEKVNTVTREVVGNFEQRFGRKWLYIGGGILLLVVAFLLCRVFGGKERPPPPPPPRPVAVTKVVQKDVPLYLNEIGTCAAVESVQIQAQVSGRIIAREFQDGGDVKKGDLLFTIDPRPYQAALDIDSAVQPGAGTVKARAQTPNPDRKLWPAAFARVRLILDTIKKATLVPSQTVQISQSGPYVFVVKADDTIELRPVKPGQPQDGDMVVVTDGLKPDEAVVVTGQLALSPGVKVVPQPYQSGRPGASAN